MRGPLCVFENERDDSRCFGFFWQKLIFEFQRGKF